VNVVLASSNRGKLAELNALLQPLGLVLHGQQELDIPDADETALTFVENAMQKARHAARACGWPAIADDSGLMVDALAGAPGVHSARYGGAHGDSDNNNRTLIAALHSTADRRARFYCALVYLRHADDPAPLIATAEWAGHIIDNPRGNGGFGYDPHFLVDGMDRTAAELSATLKNRISHRGRAAAILVGAIRQSLRRG
jgi:XTP/dITP diphosphohydrolase